MFHLAVIRRPLLAVASALALTVTVAPARAQQATTIQITYSEGAFQPSTVQAPAGKPIVFKVKNLSAKAMEFESSTLKVEKVVAARSETVINVRAQQPGAYEFYDEFNEKARGTLTVQ